MEDSENMRRMRNSGCLSVVMRCVKYVCDIKRVDRMRKGSEWWCKNVSVTVVKKRHAYGIWLQKKDEVPYKIQGEEKLSLKGCA